MPVGLQLCYDDAYARQVDATVISVAFGEGGRPPSVALDRTVFYPGGGGQPPDSGTLVRAADGATWVVRSARKADGEIVHELAISGSIGPDALPAVGDRLTAEIDWARRHLLMRTHTALHVLCGVVWRDYGAQVTGGNMEPGAGRMDFEFERMSGELVGEIERRVNAELAAARDIRVATSPARRGIRDPRPDPDQDQPPAARDRRGPHDRDRRARPPGGRRHARRQHPRGRPDPGAGLRVEGPHQQAHPDRDRGRLGSGLRRRGTIGRVESNPALAAVEAAQVAYRVVRTEAAGSAEESAAMQGIPLGALLRTIVVRRGEDDYLFVLVPAGRRFDWPKLRAHLGVSRLSLPDAEEAQRVTGYVRYTITPFGSTRPWPVIADAAILGEPVVAIGGGARGVNLHLAPAALVETLGAQVVDVTIPEA